MADNVRQPPSVLTGEIRQYLSEIAQWINAQPVHSYFTQGSPNGVIYGKAGDRATYIGSTSTLSREWVNVNDPPTVSNVSWVQVRVL